MPRSRGIEGEQYPHTRKHYINEMIYWVLIRDGGTNWMFGEDRTREGIQTPVNVEAREYRVTGRTDFHLVAYLRFPRARTDYQWVTAIGTFEEEEEMDTRIIVYYDEWFERHENYERRQRELREQIAQERNARFQNQHRISTTVNGLYSYGIGDYTIVNPPTVNVPYYTYGIDPGRVVTQDDLGEIT